MKPVTCSCYLCVTRWGGRPDRERLRRIQVILDQCWDLLHQRRARRAAGLDPDEAKVRNEKTVEGYIG